MADLASGTEYGLFMGPSFCEAASHGLPRDSASLTLPLGDRHRPAARRQVDVVPAVSVLLGRGTPRAIVRRVAFAVVRPVDRFAGRRLAHIRKEVGEIIPPLADGNASSAVVRIVGDIGVAAATAHICPNVVGSRLGTSIGCAVFKAASTRYFAGQTTARFGLSGSKGVRGNSRRFPAGAYTLPSPPPVLMGGEGCYSKAAYNKADEILNNWHGINHAAATKACQ